ncbi:MAG: iron ABC transporter permease [Deltaproteobacteria bacterium]|nr:iron ABC transporter permease [Deltaproteobacteria bacterium]MBN2673302.1 iron ABC transporter permease [Deltaproteobacteria bacterium]
MKGNRTIFFALGVILLVGLVYLSAATGTQLGHVAFNWSWPKWLFSSADSPGAAIVLALRFPRAVAAVLIGAALAVSGILLQGITRNPLADPFLLGISGGAGLAVVVIYAFPNVTQTLGWWVVPVASFAGAQGATLLVLSLARGVGQKISVIGLVLGGVIINSFCAALITFLLMQFAPLRMKVTALWLAGAVGYFGWPELLGAALFVGGALFLLRLRAGSLNAFSLGEEGASLVGVDASNVLQQTAWIASLLAGLAVSLGGLVGYVGLLVPHIVALLIGRDFRHSLLLAAVLGGIMMLLGDSAARMLFAPEEIPVGVLAALIGTPVLLVLLSRELRR